MFTMHVTREWQHPHTINSKNSELDVKPQFQMEEKLGVNAVKICSDKKPSATLHDLWFTGFK